MEQGDKRTQKSIELGKFNNMTIRIQFSDNFRSNESIDEVERMSISEEVLYLYKKESTSEKMLMFPIRHILKITQLRDPK